jgi:hypothetical protein
MKSVSMTALRMPPSELAATGPIEGVNCETEVVLVSVS